MPVILVLLFIPPLLVAGIASYLVFRAESKK